MTVTETELTWEVPPKIMRTGAGRRSKYAPILEQLSANPGEWALVNESDTKSRSGQYAYIKKVLNGCEVTSRTIDHGDGTFNVKVYARWIGEENVLPAPTFE